MQSYVSDSKSSRLTEARRFSRLPADFAVHVQSDELRVYDRAADISEAGICVVTPRPIPIMSRITLRLDLPHGVEAVEMIGTVVWVKGHTMGIRFEQTDPRLTDAVWRIRQDYLRI